jgi:RHS repeat-associated protein
MQTFRRLSRRSWLLHLYLMLSMVFWPLPPSGAYWTRDASGEKISQTDPTDSEDSWWSEDPDGDLLVNAAEVLYSSDPYNRDTDYDGISDKDERDFTAVIQDGINPTDPWLWDTDGDGFSDHDEYICYLRGGTTPNVNYVTLVSQGTFFFSYSDADGDGCINPDDSHPLDSSRQSDWNDNGVNDSDENPDPDGDGYIGGDDSNEGNAALWEDWNGNGTNDSQENSTEDFDGDGYSGSNDSHEGNAALWEDWNGNGTNDSQESVLTDADGDGYFGAADSDEGNSSLWEDWNRNGTNDAQENPVSDTDGDGYAGDNDSHEGNSALWEDWNGNNQNDSEENPPSDTDGDGHEGSDDSHEGNSALWEDWNNNGQNDSAEASPPAADIDADGHTGADDSHEGNASLWEDWDGDDQNDSEESSDDEGGGAEVDTDGDTHPDSEDSHPSDANLWCDEDDNGYNDDVITNGDGDALPDGTDSHPATPWLWDDRNDNGVNDFDEPPDYDADDDGVLDEDDSTDDNNSLWSDWDHDGLNYEDEAPNNANPDLADTDGDGLNDGEEVTAKTRCDYPDTDGDGLTDSEEILIYFTNPLLQRSRPSQPYTDYFAVNTGDSDGDTIPDRVESWYQQNDYGMDPIHSEDAAGDLDGDGYTNLQAYNWGWSLTRNLNLLDSDSDGITNITEESWNAYRSGTLNPYNRVDATADYDHDGLLNIEEVRLGFNLTLSSTYNSQETGSPVPDLAYANDLWHLGWSPCLSPGLPGNDADNDTDGDGMSDAWEHLHHFNWRSASDAIRDPDRDSLSNLTEFRFGTHPYIPKTYQNRTDSGRLYATGSPVNASTAGGLMGRYLAQVTADLSSSAQASRYTTEIVIPSSGGGQTPPPPVFKYSIKQETDILVPDADQPEASTTGWISGAQATVRSRYSPAHSEPCSCGAYVSIPQDADPDDYCHCGRPNDHSCAGGDFPKSRNSESVRFRVEVPVWSHTPGLGWSGSVRVFGVFSNQNQSRPVSVVCVEPPVDFAVTEYLSAGNVTEEDPFDQRTYYIKELKPNDDADTPPLSISASDSAGGRYRKIGLQGFPAPDSKPQVQDESGERREETYIDAYTRHLQHSVTDIYAADESTLLPLSVRRDVVSESWGLRGGVRPGERMDLPFGAGWRSNICSYVCFEANSDKAVITATVVDEQGATQRYLKHLQIGDWEHSQEELSNAKTIGSHFNGDPTSNAVLEKKFGITCTYTPVLINGYLFSKDRISGSDDVTSLKYSRLTQVTDRLGNKLIYEYPDAWSLVPKKIYDPDRPGRKITFELDGHGHVKRARGPAGEEVDYDYQAGFLYAADLGLFGENTGNLLHQVRRGNSLVSYGYNNERERDVNFYRWGGSESPCEHLDVSSITDERGNSYVFSYAFDQDVTYQTYNSDGYFEDRVQIGSPRVVTSIRLPDAGKQVLVQGSHKIHAGWPKTSSWPATGTFDQSLVTASSASTFVTGPAGGYTYEFYSPFVRVPSFGGMRMSATRDPTSINATVTYTWMSVQSAGQRELYSYCPPFFALASVKDASGRTTSFEYEMPLSDDPTAEVDALNQRKEYTYGVFDIMTSMKDSSGVLTSYSLDELGRKTSETVKDTAGNVLRTTDYEYLHPDFKGFVTKQTTDGTSADTAPPTIISFSLGSDKSRAGWWAEVTSSSLAKAGVPASVVSSTTTKDLSGNKRSVTDARGFITNFDYDSSLRLSRVDHPDLSFKKLGYDEHGNLVKEELGCQTVAGADIVMRRTFHAYDSFNRRVSTTLDLNLNGSSEASYESSNTSQGSAAATPVYDGDITTSVTYNDWNLPLAETDARGTLIQHQYDKLGRRISTMVNPGGQNGLSLVTSFNDFVGGSVFDLSGYKPRLLVDSSGNLTEVEYDELHRELSRKVTFISALDTNPAYLTACAQRAQRAVGLLSGFATQSEQAFDAKNVQITNGSNRVPVAQTELYAAQQRIPVVQAQGAASVAAAHNLVEEINSRITPLPPEVAVLLEARNQATTRHAAAQVEEPLAFAALTSARASLAALPEDAGEFERMEAGTRVTEAEMRHAAATSELATAAGGKTAALAAIDTWQTTANADATQKDSAANIAESAASLAASSWQTAEDAAIDAEQAAMANPTDQQLQIAASNARSAANDLLPEKSTTAMNAAQSRTEANTASKYASCLAGADGLQQELAAAQEALVAAQSSADRANGLARELVSDLQAEISRLQSQIPAWTAELPLLQAQAEVARQKLDQASALLPAVSSSTSWRAAHQALLSVLKVLNGTPHSGLGLGDLPSRFIPQTSQAVTQTFYNATGQPIKIIDPLDRVTLTEYDAFGQPVKVTEPDLTTNTADNPTVRTFYTHHGKPWKVIDQNGTETITTYDALGRAISVQGPVLDAQGTRAVTTNEYDAAGNVIRVTDPLGRVTETLYDARNRPWKVYAPTVWDAEIGQYVRPTSETTYDALGQVIEVKDPIGAITTTHYDRAGRKWCVQAPAPASAASSAVRPTTVTTFDPGGLPLTVTNPLGQTITNTYDAHGRLTQTVDAEGIVNQFAYDAAGNRTSVKDGLNQETTFAYDGLNRLISQSFANGDTWTHSYNAIQKLSQTSPRGIVTSYTYDARDRLLTVNAPAHAASGTPALRRDYNYDNAGRLLTVTEYTQASLISNPSSPVPDPGTSVSYTYDAMGRVTAESSHGQTHFYEYDLAGNRVRAEYSTGRVVETSYDGLNRPEAIAEGPRLTRYGYDLAGRALLLVSPNGQTSLNTYDRLGRLTDRTLFRNPGMAEVDVLAEFSWSHDLLGNVTAQYETWPGEAERIPGVRVTSMGYDANNRLTSEVITQPEVNGATPTTTTLYTYDAANNRSSKTVTRTIAGEEPVSDEDTGHWSYTYNSANQLTAWSKRSEAGNTTVQKSAALTYDAAGNRISQSVTEESPPQVASGLTPPAAQPGTTTYTWDAQDRLASVTIPAQPGTANSELRTFSYQYDYRTRRIGTSEASSAAGSTAKHTAIVFSGGLSVAEWETTGNSEPGTANPPTVEYTRGPDMGGGVGGLLYTSRSESASASVSSRTLRYNLSNGRGDIVAQADSSAALTWTASYEAYGKRTKETGENKDKQRGNSKDEDPTGLLNEGFRYRDLETGVWLSRDPAGFVDGPNLYAYIRQNPWTGWDPHGLSPCWADPRSLPWCSSQMRTALDEHDRQTAASLAQDCQAVGQWMNEHPRTLGAFRAVGGAAETTLGVAGLLTPEPTMVTKALGGAAVAHGADTFIAGLRQMMTGKPADTITQRGIATIAEKAGASPETAKTIGAFGDAGLGILTTCGVSSVTSSSAVATRVASAEASKLASASPGIKGVVSALVVPQPWSLRPLVFVGKSERAGGLGVAGMHTDVLNVARQFESAYGYGCAEVQAFSQALRAGVNPAGGASSAWSLIRQTAMEACDNCKEVLKAFKVKDANAR